MAERFVNASAIAQHRQIGRSFCVVAETSPERVANHGPSAKFAVQASCLHLSAKTFGAAETAALAVSLNWADAHLLALPPGIGQQAEEPANRQKDGRGFGCRCRR